MGHDEAVTDETPNPLPASVDAAARRNANLRPLKPGQSGNPSGSNRWMAAQARIAKIMSEYEPGAKTNRLDDVILAAYKTAMLPGLKGAPDRKLLIEHSAGKPKVAVDVSSPDGSLGSAATSRTTAELRELIMLALGVKASEVAAAAEKVAEQSQVDADGGPGKSE